jgi:hypothetical protein
MQLTVRDLTSARQLEGLFILGQDIPHGVVAGHRADAAGINGANQGDHSAVLDVALIELARDARTEMSSMMASQVVSGLFPASTAPMARRFSWHSQFILTALEIS